MCRVVACGRGGCRAQRLRYGIEATRMPRMASPNALHSQPTAPDRSESIECLEGVVGTGRMESACGTEKRAHGPLVDPNQECGDVAHGAFYFSILTEYRRTSVQQRRQTCLPRSSTARSGSRATPR